MCKKMPVLFLFFLLVSCRGVNVKHNARALNADKGFNNYFVQTEEIELKGNEYFGTIDEVLFWNEKIIIGDFSQAKKVFVYSKEGKQIGLIGKIGQAPGDYQSVNLFFPLNNEIWLFDGLRGVFVIYNKEFVFERELKFYKELNFFSPEWFSLFSTGEIALFSPREDDTGYRVYVFSKGFKMVKSFADDEAMTRYILFSGLKNICVDRLDRVWVAGFFYPDIEVYSKNGKELFAINDFCKRKDFLNLKKGKKMSFREFQKKYYSKKGAIIGIFSINDRILVYYAIPYTKGSRVYVKHYFSLYDLKGNLIAKDIEVPGSLSFVNVWNNSLIFYDIWCKEVEENNLNGILYFYKLK